MLFSALNESVHSFFYVLSWVSFTTVINHSTSIIRTQLRVSRLKWTEWKKTGLKSDCILWGRSEKSPNVVKHSVGNYCFLWFIIQASVLRNFRQFNKTYTGLCLPANPPLWYNMHWSSVKHIIFSVFTLSDLFRMRSHVQFRRELKSNPFCGTRITC